MQEAAETLIKLESEKTSIPIPSLIHNISWMLRGNLIYAACQWGIVVVLAKFSTPEMLGIFSLASAIATPVFMLANLHLRAVQVTDARGTHSFREYITLRILTTISALVVIFLISFSREYTETAVVVILFVALFKATEAIGEIYYGFLQRHERMDRIAKSLMFKGATSLLAFAIVINATEDIRWGAASLVFTSVTILLTYDIPGKLLISRVSLPPTSAGPAQQQQELIARVTQLALLALPLGLVMGLISLNLNLPRYFISHFLGEHELGIFSAIAYVIAGSSTVIDALGQAASPRLANFYAVGDMKSFRLLAVRLVSFGIGIGVCALITAHLAGSQLLTILYSRDYANRTDLFFWLMLSTPLLFGATFSSYVITAARYFRAQVPIFLVTTCVTAAACTLLGSRYGLNGVAIALLLSAIVQFLGSVAVAVYACTTGVPRPLVVASR